MKQKKLNYKQLTRIIIKIISSNYNQENISALFHFCKSLSLSYLINQHQKQKLLLRIYTQERNFLDDFAIDAVATLFTRDSDDRFYILIKYFEPYLGQITEQNELSLVYLRKLVVSKTKQEIIEYYKKENPSGWKIFRNVKEAPNRNTNIGVNIDFHNKYYYLFNDNRSLSRMIIFQDSRISMRECFASGYLKNITIPAKHLK